MNKAVLFLLALVAAPYLHARHLGVLGQTYPVGETSLLELIQARVYQLQQGGSWGTQEEQWKQQIQAHVLRPRPLSLSRTNKKEAHFYTPAASIDHDVRNAQGTVMIPKGSQVNALKTMPNYQPVWLFFNGDDPAQQKFAQTILLQHRDVELILTGGNVREAQVQLKQTIYFDQGGRITHQLSIHHVPALVTREEDSLKITEYALGEDGHAL